MVVGVNIQLNVEELRLIFGKWEFDEVPLLRIGTLEALAFRLTGVVVSLTDTEVTP